MKCSLQEEDVMQSLDDLGVIVGIDQNAISEAVAFFRNNPESFKMYTVAAAKASRRITSDIQLFFSEDRMEFEQQDENGNVAIVSFMHTALVSQGEVLAGRCDEDSSGPNRNVFGNQPTAADELERVELVCGNNVEYIEEEGTYVASKYGYPAVIREIVERKSVCTLFVDPVVRVKPDALSAALVIRPLAPGEQEPDMELLTEILTSENVVYGILSGQLRKCIELLRTQNLPVERKVAMGIKPVNGVDARLRFHIEVGPLPGKIRGDGSIDFRERKMFVGVEDGELIAVKIPSTTGKPGKNVHGETVQQKPGRDIVIKVTGDAMYNDETGEVRASRSGVLSMVSEHSVKVCSKQVVSGDVDFSTGNIISSGALEIRGSIKPKFRVVALGDVTVGGSVENATLRGDADIIIKGGIVGRDAKIKARGEADLNFLENGRAFSGGNVVLRKSCYYCRLHSWKDVICAPDSIIVGSQLVASGSLVLGNVGIENARPSFLGVSIDPALFQKHFDLLRVKLILQNEYDRLCQRFGQKKKENQIVLEARKKLEEAEEAVNQLNIVSGSWSDETSTKAPMRVLQETITVHGTICKGTVLRMGNQLMELKQNMSKVRFQLSRSAGVGSQKESIVAVQL